MKDIKEILEQKFDRVVELVKEWQDLNLATRTDIIDIPIRYDVKAKEWIVEVFGGSEAAQTLETALDKQILELETDFDYLYRKREERRAEISEREVLDETEKNKQRNNFN